MYVNTARSGLGAFPARRSPSRPLQFVAVPARHPRGLFLVPRRGLGALVTDWRDAKPGDYMVDSQGRLETFTGSGWTTNAQTQAIEQAARTAAQAPVQIEGAGGFESSLVPGMSSATMAPSLATALQSFIDVASSPFIVNNIRTGATTPQQEAQYIREKAAQWAALNPQLAAATNWQQAAEQAAQRYLSWVAAGAAQYSSTTGALIPYLGSQAGYQQSGPYSSGAPLNFDPAFLASALPSSGGSGTIPPPGGGRSGDRAPYIPPAPPAPPPTPTTATIRNVSRPGQGFVVGDSWELTITGAPNQPVSATAVVAGVSQTTPFGTTDANGKKVLTGKFEASAVGQNKQKWTVGSVSTTNDLTFTVAAVGSNPPPPPSGGGGGNDSAGNNNGGGGSITDLLTKKVSLLGLDIPVWAIGAAAVGGVYLASQGGRR